MSGEGLGAPGKTATTHITLDPTTRKRAVEAPSAPVRASEVCLKCGQDRAEIRAYQRNGEPLECALGDTEDTLGMDMGRHRFQPYTDKELARFGLKPEAFDRYRLGMGQACMIPCTDRVEGHEHPREQDFVMDGYVVHRTGTCPRCGASVPPETT